MTIDQLIPWFSTVLCLITWTYLVKPDNIFYRISANSIIAVTVGQGLILSVLSVRDKISLLGVHWTYFIPLILGVMLFSQWNTKYRWVARYPNTIAIAVGLGISTGLLLRSQILNQLSTTISNITKATTPFNIFSSYLFFIGVMTSLTYWIYSIGLRGKTSRALTWSSRIGRIFIMMSLGSVWGTRMVSDIDSLILSLVTVLRNTAKTLI